MHPAEMTLSARLELPEPRWHAQRGRTGWEDTSRQTVESLAALSGMPTWHVGRVIDNVLTPLAVSTGAVGIATGTRVNWSPTVCRRMVSRLGPNLAPDVLAIPDYAGAPAVRKLGMRAYAGVPLLTEHGDLLGVLAGWHTEPREFPPGLEPLLWALSNLMAGVLQSELRATRAVRTTETRAPAPVVVTAGASRLPARRGWGAILEQEERRARDLGTPVTVLLVDFGSLRSAARAQKAARIAVDHLRDAVLARLSVRHIGAVLNDCTQAQVDRLGQRVDAALRKAGFTATTASASRLETSDLRDTWSLAEQRLFEQRKAAR
ncbi:hypothetical protein [Mangrovihabitans endophyticus]|uniref:Histidine kinase n=1 Tax=Mangrovihabitans endophyticus TaxID=1751298 RepID=A0A8J3C452_9ACTN|nr:hypothetical protein [Mangrovihabitans endophyticus]GGL15063.1 histidine kinase [Mangrovihabitans endophyticus]